MKADFPESQARRPTRTPLLLALLLAVAAGSGAAATAGGLEFGPPPDWLLPLSVDLEQETPAEYGEGIHHLALDIQVNDALPEREWYSRHLRRILNGTGVQTGSRLELSFDPSYQSLVMHEVWIHRDGRRLQRLDPAKVELLHREPGLPESTYDGSRTALLFLEDVRPGDVIETTLSRRGSNPVLGNRFSTEVDHQWSTPLVRGRFRGIWPTSREPRWRLHRSELQPERIETAGLVELRWELRDRPALHPPDHLPAWLDPWPASQLSNWESWGEVSTWASGLFRIPAELPLELAALLPPLREGDPEPLELARRALRLVQDEVRYLGIEFGPQAYRPSDPLAVYQRRYGDCKDKTLLLVTLLRGLGLDAEPALVNTSHGPTLDQLLPTQRAFDHAIVHLRAEGRSWWLDATALHERGALADRPVPDYRWALLARPGAEPLVPVEPRHTEQVEVDETYRSIGFVEPVEFRVATTFRGAEADSFRGLLSDKDREELQDEYIDYYRRQHSGIESTAALEIEDDEKDNTIRTVEHYRIREFWTRDEELSAWTCALWNLQLDDRLTAPPVGPRDLPLAITHPVSIEQRTQLWLHDDGGSFEDETLELEGEALRFDYTVRTEGRRLDIRHAMRSQVASLPAESVEAHRADVERARETLGYEIIWSTDVDLKGALLQPNWLMIGVSLLSFVAALLGGLLLQRLRRGPPPGAEGVEPALRGIRGWLMLPAIGILFSPIALLKDILSEGGIYSLPVWRRLTTQGQPEYDSIWAPLLSLEAITGPALFGLSLVVIVAFFRRKRMAPALYILMAWSSILVTALGAAGLACLPDMRHEALVEAGGTVGRLFITTIWTVYFLTSRRVRGTFVR